MTEPNRATWAEFAEWMNARCDWWTQEGYAMTRAAPLLRSKADTRIAYAAAYGYGDDDFERDVAAWIETLRSEGVEPPAEPPSVAEVLESVAAQLDGRMSELRDDVDVARSGGWSGLDEIERDMCLDRIDDLRSQTTGIEYAVECVRAKGKEFT